MRNPFSVKHIVAIFLIAQTAIILMLVFFVFRAIIPSVRPVVFVGGIALGIAITIFTADRIIHHVNAKYAHNAKGLKKYAKELQAKSKALDDYALVLKGCALNMSEQQHELQKRSKMLNEYGKKMNALMEEMDTSIDRVGNPA